VNAISDEWVRQFDARLDELTARADWKILHIRSDQKAFCAGADLKEVQARIDEHDGPDRMYAYVAAIQRLFARIESLRQVTLAEIGGAAMGGGFELALSCDLRIASIDASVGLPELRLGLIPGGGGTQRLTRLCGPAIAARLILGAETVGGSVARELGLVQWVAAREDLVTHAATIARRIAELPTAALAAAKVCIAAAREPGRGGYSDELEATYRLLSDPDTRKRVDAFFAAPAKDSSRVRQGALS
jgi:enoyl-CoA hydratase/carnithine racemase